MKNLSDLEKKVNSELTTKVKSTKIKHKHICINIENENLITLQQIHNMIPARGPQTIYLGHFGT